MKGAPPLRFLGIVLGGWVCARAAMLMPGWMESDRGAITSVAPPATAIADKAPSLPPMFDPPILLSGVGAVTTSDPNMHRNSELKRITLPPSGGHAPQPGTLVAAQLGTPAPPTAVSRKDLATTPALSLSRAGPAGHISSRMSASAWLFVRRGDAPQLAAASAMLGGSQAGARFGYRLNDDPDRPLALSARFYSPLRDQRGAEASLGVEWKPMGRLPISLLAERRQAIGRDGRSAFAVMAFGGLSDRKLAGPLILDTYAQAGLVGAKSRDAFIDGAIAIALPVEEAQNARIGAAIWGAAQPGISRVDLGPQASYRLRTNGGSVRIAAEWRMRILGDAAPASGPALTLSTAF